MDLGFGDEKWWLTASGYVTADPHGGWRPEAAVYAIILEDNLEVTIRPYATVQ